MAEWRSEIGRTRSVSGGLDLHSATRERQEMSGCGAERNGGEMGSRRLELHAVDRDLRRGAVDADGRRVRGQIERAQIAVPDRPVDADVGRDGSAGQTDRKAADGGAGAYTVRHRDGVASHAAEADQRSVDVQERSAAEAERG